MQSKKSPQHGDIAILAEAWSSRYQSSPGYRLVAKQLIEHAGSLAPAQLTTIIPAAMLAGWRKNSAPGYLYKQATGLRSLLAFLREHGAPKITLQRVRQPQPRGITASPEQIARLLAAAQPDMRLFILLCWQLALRFSEAVSVTPRSWDKDAGTISILTKGGKPRCIPATDEIERLIAAAADCGDRDTSCIQILHGRRRNPSCIRQAWWRLTKAAEVSGITPHDLRRTTATNLYALSKDLRAVQQYLGHTRLQSTLHYLAPIGDEQLKHYQQLLSFRNFKSEVKQ